MAQFPVLTLAGLSVVINPAKLLSFTRRLIAGGRPRSPVRFASTTTITGTMTAKETTRIVAAQRLNIACPKDKSIAEWWASERNGKTSEAAAIEEDAELLRTSDVPVAFPTETVYGLGADATRSEAVQGIYKAKQRPSDNPLIIHVDSLEMLERLLNPIMSPASATRTLPKSIPPVYHSVISRFWPGPLTIILPNPSGSLLAKEVTSDLTTFGVRMPASPLARLLIHATDRPLAAPSANASTKPSPTTAQHVYHDLHGRIELILDGGPCSVGVESTVVDGLSDPPAILRPGGIGIDDLRKCEGWENVQVAYHDHSLEAKEAPRAPGMKYRHYSPKARVILFEPDCDEKAVARRVHKDMEDTAVGAHSVGIVRTCHWTPGLGLSSPEEKEKTLERIQAAPLGSLVPFSVPLKDHVKDCLTSKRAIDCALGTSTEEVARGLFATLRAMDDEQVDVIYVEGLAAEHGDLHAAVMNRLRKAAGAELQV